MRSTSCLRHVVSGEAGNAFVVVREALELSAGDVAIKVLERDIAHQLLHAADEIIGRMLAVSAHDACRRPRARDWRYATIARCA